jgi:hypothetical protein
MKYVLILLLVCMYIVSCVGVSVCVFFPYLILVGIGNCYMRAIQKVISGELLTKQAVRKKNVIRFKKYVHVSQHRIELLVVSQNMFLYACVKDVYHLLSSATF